MISTELRHPVISLLVVGVLGLASALPVAATSASNPPKTVAKQVGFKSTKIPLAFQQNVGQTSSRVKFVSSGPQNTVFLSPDGVVVTLAPVSPAPLAATKTNPSEAARALAGKQPNPESVLRMNLVGANSTAVMVGSGPLPGATNYLFGRNPKHWLTNVSSYTRVTEAAAYPGIDLSFYGNGPDLEYDFALAPGADPAAIVMAFTADSATILPDGNVQLMVGGRALIQRRPVAYQPTATGSAPVAARYIAKGANRFGFAVGSYDPATPIVIDPVLSYSTYLGGSGQDDAYGIAVDSAGNAYVAGTTNSMDYPSSTPWPGSSAGHFHAFVSKLNAAGNALVYSTYLGGRVDDEALAIAVDNGGNAYVTGATTSSDFPTANAVQPSFGGGVDGFVAELNSSGSALVYSTYLGGSATDIGYGIAVGPSGSASVTGVTNSSNFPIVAAMRATEAGGMDAFVTKLAPGGRSIAYSTYLGGSGDDGGARIALDSAGNTYVVGSTSSPNFPTVNAFQATYGTNVDAFVAKLNSAGSSLIYSTFLGGSGYDTAVGLAIDGTGSAYVSGYTSSTDFPTFNPAEWANSGGGDAFVAKLTPAGNGVVYSTYLGGASIDLSYGVGVDALGDAFVGGVTGSTNFPIASPVQGVNGGGSDAFLTELDPSGGIRFSTYLGGSADDGALALAVDTSGNAYLTGFTRSTNFPTASAYQVSSRGSDDVFVAKFPPAAPAAHEWTTSFAANDHTGYNPTPSSLTTASASSSKLKWTVHTPGQLTGEPVGANGLIYFGSWDGYERAVDKTGHVVWSTYVGVTFNDPPPPGCLGGGGGPTGTPTAVTIWNASLLYVSGGDSNLYAIDALTGAIDWHTRLGPTPQSFLWSSPTVYNGSVYVGLGSLQECPAVQGKVFQLSTVTGAVQHVFNTTPDGCTGAPVLTTGAVDPADGSIYFAAGNSPGTCSSPYQYTASILKFRASDLTLLDHWQMPAAEQTISDPDFGASPMLFDATIAGVQHPMLGLVNKTGVYYAFDRSALSAGPLWRATIAVGNNCPVCGPGAAIATSAFDGNSVYVGGTATTINGVSCAGSLRALDPSSGAFRWERCLNYPILASISAAPGLVVAAWGPDLTIFAADTGSTLFVYHDPNPSPTPTLGTTANFWGGAAISEGVIYQGNIDGNLFAVSP